MSHTTRLLNRLQDQATIYVHDPMRPQMAAEIGSLVAALAILPEPRAIAHAVAQLLFTEQVGMRAHYLEVLQHEINAELKHWGSGR